MLSVYIIFSIISTCVFYFQICIFFTLFTDSFFYNFFKHKISVFPQSCLFTGGTGCCLIRCWQYLNFFGIPALRANPSPISSTLSLFLCFFFSFVVVVSPLFLFPCRDIMSFWLSTLIFLAFSFIHSAMSLDKTPVTLPRKLWMFMYRTVSLLSSFNSCGALRLARFVYQFIFPGDKTGVVPWRCFLFNNDKYNMCLSLFSCWGCPSFSLR